MMPQLVGDDVGAGEIALRTDVLLEGGQEGESAMNTA